MPGTRHGPRCVRLAADRYHVATATATAVTAVAVTATAVTAVAVTHVTTSSKP
ncbi:hypothetical protein [Streptomyces fumanus]|uniref:Uncharacterized protein n=1 Tax=Streptomyces fumanus TaxID=67302 RepID=A0A919A660_9ACTN|nr:hypothetical protein [Streptomyces fumanus]GHE87985.1 hypothetical protein GCM10018772_09420 [Streptomyces fumanus]